jgi:hypothetical protein
VPPEERKKIEKFICGDLLNKMHQIYLYLEKIQGNEELSKQLIGGLISKHNVSNTDKQEG